MTNQSPDTSKTASNTLQLILATGAFAVCFSIFGSVSAMMPILRKQLGLDPMQVSIALAFPVLLGSLGRIPLGILTDRYGGRLIFSIIMSLSIIPAFLMGFVGSYVQLLVCSLFIGIALASFSVGVGFVSGWYSAERQGMALGVYGAGNAGQSLAAFGAPIIAGMFGYRWGFWVFAVLTLAWLIVFILAARNAPKTTAPKTLKQVIEPLKDKQSWKLSLYYFLTFGGFVAMSVYLPTFLTELFKLSVQDAGLRTAGFVLLATAMRPVGGALADRVGGRTILCGVFPFITVMALLMSIPSIITFTIGALGMATAIGLGNGAVFQLVPEYFPKSVGSVTGLVGAAGGLGGFFPPLLLGTIKQTTDSFTGGFILLAVFAIFCFLIVWQVGTKTFQQA